FIHDAPTTENDPLSLHDALPIYREIGGVALALDLVDPAFTPVGHRTREAAIVGDGRDVEIEAAVQFIAMRVGDALREGDHPRHIDRKSTRLNSSHVKISYAVFCL